VAVLILVAAGAIPAAAQESARLPRTLAQDPQAEPARPTTPPAPQEADGSAFIDFHRTELEPHLGVLAFASDYESSAKFGGGVLVRAPLPWFSRDVLGFERDAVGAFLDLTISSIVRDIDLLDQKSGTLMFVTLGLDYAFYSDENFRAQLQLGVQYGYFGGVTDLHNGIAPLVGLAARLALGPGIGLTFNPQAGFGDSGDTIYFINLGVQIDF
jgi:hypothetical protein